MIRARRAWSRRSRRRCSSRFGSTSAAGTPRRRGRHSSATSRRTCSRRLTTSRSAVRSLASWPPSRPVRFRQRGEPGAGAHRAEATFPCRRGRRRRRPRRPTTCSASSPGAEQRRRPAPRPRRPGGFGVHRRGPARPAEHRRCLQPRGRAARAASHRRPPRPEVRAAAFAAPATAARARARPARGTDARVRDHVPDPARRLARAARPGSACGAGVGSRRAGSLRAAAAASPPSGASYRREPSLIGVVALLVLAAMQPVVRTTTSSVADRRAAVHRSRHVPVDGGRRFADEPDAAGPAERMALELGPQSRDLPVGVATFTDRVLPNLFPTSDRAAFDSAVSADRRRPAAAERQHCRDDLRRTVLARDGRVLPGPSTSVRSS